jgi:hypothetical protein
LAVVLDLPSELRAGGTDLDGSITIMNMNSESDVASRNLVYEIVVTPSCGTHAQSGECPLGGEDPGVLTVDPIAVGRTGTACAGTVFTVKPRSAETGAVHFDAAEEKVILGAVSDEPASRQCTIDFSFSYTAYPQKSASSAVTGGGAETTAYVAAQAVSLSGLRSAVAGNMTKLQLR